MKIKTDDLIVVGQYDVNEPIVVEDKSIIEHIATDDNLMTCKVWDGNSHGFVFVVDTDQNNMITCSIRYEISPEVDESTTCDIRFIIDDYFNTNHFSKVLTYINKNLAYDTIKIDDDVPAEFKYYFESTNKNKKVLIK